MEIEMDMRGESIIEYSSSHMVDGSEKRKWSTKKMAQLCRKMVIKWRVVGGGGVCILQELFRFIWDKIMVCSIGKPIGYRRLSTSPNPSPSFYDHPTPTTIHQSHNNNPVLISGYNSDSDSDLVCLKICLLGDCHIGKTSFMIKYVGDEQGTRCLETKGLNLTDKTLFVRDARIAVSVWDVGGDYRSRDQLPIACKDAVAILFMFDLTSRCTLNSVVEWYNEARRWNQSAIPILVGTKFDDFVQLPPDIQWTIVTQARGYARAMKATLFFSSATHNINVNKIFKFIMAKLFNLQWSLHRNLNPGEPIIDF